LLFGIYMYIYRVSHSLPNPALTILQRVNTLYMRRYLNVRSDGVDMPVDKASEATNQFQ